MRKVISLFTLAFLVKGAPLNERKCELPPYSLNELLQKPIEEASFSVEPAVALGYSEDVIAASVDAVLNAILERNKTFSKDTLRPCVEAYLGMVPSRPIPGSNAKKPAGGLSYNKPWYLGGTSSLGVPVPDDDDYRPGSEGYTTYINPHKFLDKAEGYIPAAIFSHRDLFKVFLEAIGKLTTDVSETIEGATQNFTLENFLENFAY